MRLIDRKGVRASVIQACVIVGSILAAFAVDTAWDGWRDRSQERSLLQALRVEFLSARHQVERYRVTQRRIHASLQFAIDALEDARAAGLPSALIPDSVLALGYQVPAIQGGLSTLIWLREAGRLETLSDPELRSALITSQMLIDDLTPEEAGAREYVRNHFDPVLRRSVDVSSLRALAPSRLASSKDGPSRGRTHLVPSELEIIGVFAGRKSDVDSILEESTLALDHINRVVELLQGRLMWR